MSKGDLYKKISGSYVLQGNIGGGTSGGSGGVGTFPNLKVTSNIQVTVPKGTYPAAGYRHKGVFPEAGAGSFVVSSDALITLLSGSISGPNPLWCSVFLTGTNIALILPFIGVKGTPSYSAPNTTIHPGMSDGAGDMSDVGIVTNWQTQLGYTLAGYRLVKHSYDTYDGTVVTIGSVAASSPDNIVLSGNQTTALTDKDWLRMIPPVSIPCLYLGLVVFNGQDLASYLKQAGWDYFWTDNSGAATGILSATQGWTDLGSSPYGVSPSAIKATGDVYCSSGTNNAESVKVALYADIANNPTKTLQFGTPSTNTHKYMEMPFDYFFNKPAQIGNAMTYYDGANVQSATDGGFAISSFEE